MGKHGKQVPISQTNSRAARNAHARATEEFKTYDTSAIKHKVSRAPIYIAIGVVLVIAIIVVALVLTGCSGSGAKTISPDEEVVITVEPGESAQTVASSLLDARAIGSTEAFLDAVKSRDAGGSIIPGVYLIKGSMTPDDIIDAMLIGPSATADTLTIPEGFTRSAVADAVDDATRGRISAEQFLDATDDASDYVGEFSFLQSAGSEDLEGFLFPKTYSVTAADDAESVAKMMLRQFGIETEGVDLAYARARNLDLYDVVKLASIVEKEGKAENFATVASVFYNRLASSRPYLESDATTAYEVGHDPSGEEVHADTPYSTYANPGLPPTPICNPSLAAIEAAANPEKTNYMYFYSHPDGTYAFSVTYDQHQSEYQ